MCRGLKFNRGCDRNIGAAIRVLQSRFPAQEAELDALLKAHEAQKVQNAGDRDKPGSKPSPVQELRRGFGQHFVPSVEMPAQRLGERGIVVQMDASDFLGGGRISSGPMLRTRSLTAETFVKFLYERVIKLVQEVTRRS